MVQLKYFLIASIITFSFIRGMDRSSLSIHTHTKPLEDISSYEYEPINGPDNCCDLVTGCCGFVLITVVSGFLTIATTDHLLGLELFGEPSLLMRMMRPGSDQVCHCEKIL